MFIEALMLFLAFITLAISSGFITNASVRLTGIDVYNTNSELQAAHTKTVYAAVIGWISVALILGIFIFYLIYSNNLNKTVFLIFFIVTMIVVIIIGILSAMAAYHINQSNVSNNNLSYQQSIIATVLAIVVFFLLLFSLFILMYSKSGSKEKEEETEIPKEIYKAKETPKQLQTYQEPIPERNIFRNYPKDNMPPREEQIQAVKNLRNYSNDEWKKNIKQYVGITPPSWLINMGRRAADKYVAEQYPEALE